MFKESNKDIAVYRVNRGQGVSEDYMILGKSSCLFTDKRITRLGFQYNIINYAVELQKYSIVHKSNHFLNHFTTTYT